MAGPYADWRAAVNYLFSAQRFERLMSIGYAYNYRLWIRGPLLRMHG